jgi:hypothetical protein
MAAAFRVRERSMPQDHGGETRRRQSRSFDEHGGSARHQGRVAEEICIVRSGPTVGHATDRASFQVIVPHMIRPG